MTPEQTLQVIKTLSALESWTFALKERVPDYLHDDLTECVTFLTEDLLGKPEPVGSVVYTEEPF
jgi:hypothetical protein